MIERLGNVLYWLGCTICGLLLLGAAMWFVIMTQSGNPSDVSGAPFVAGVFAVFALISWLIGRACRYVLSGS